jgi:hypothetical protein
MLNRDCERESQSRIVRKADIRIDSEYHNPLLTPQEVEYEASRCLGTIHCEACDVCRLLCLDKSLLILIIVRDVAYVHLCVQKGQLQWF